jgi:alpha-methylacyl-CoA racemase
VCSVEEAMRDPHFAARGIFSRSLTDGARSITALPVPIADAFRGNVRAAGYPALGEGNGLLDGK